MEEPLLRVQDLQVSFRSGSRGTATVVKGLSFDVFRGRMTALVGESGSGKSVTSMSILKLHPERRTLYSGRILLEESDLLSFSPAKMRQVRGRRISMIFQEPMMSLNPIMPISKQLAESLHAHTDRGLLNPRETRERILHYLDLVRLPDPASRLQSYPHEFSGGQRQRIMIAMALLNEPQILIADEPTTALDVTVQEQILKLLREIQEKSHMGILFVSHDLHVVRTFSDQVCVMKDGKILEQGPTEEIFSRPAHPYTRLLLEAEPTGHKSLVTGREPVLDCQDLRVRFPLTKNLFGRPTTWLDAVSSATFGLLPRQSLGLVGESGSGKSTLAKALMRLVPVSQGKYRIGNIYSDEIPGFTRQERKDLTKKIQMVFQDPYGSLPEKMTAGEIIRESLDIHFPHIPRQAKESRVDRMLKEVNLPLDSKSRYPHEFSGGQRQRISIARALILEPEILILDEPTSALDRTTQITIIELLRNLQIRFGMSYIFISHDLSVVLALCDYVLLMQAGRIVEWGPALKFFTHPRTDYGKTFVEGSHVIPENHLRPYDGQVTELYEKIC